jgi:hypothetical protein
MAAHRKSDQRRDDLCAGELRKNVCAGHCAGPVVSRSDWLGLIWVQPRAAREGAMKAE